MDLSDLLASDRAVLSVKSTSKKHLLQEIGKRAAEIYGLDARAVFDALMERERLGPTATGRGVAIPHARLEGIDGIVGLFARLANGVDFDAVDDAPVDLAFVLLAPLDAGADHLKALARVSRTMREETVCSKIRAASDEAAIYSILTEPTASSRAA